ncbi:PhiH1 repressor [Haloferax sp. Atlit-4N]|uniref:PhiH1 repressor n=1 Tax=Haloferax sp. Atlit-4N TaxID=2077206 RepID=UPI000E2751A7|nr:PhiH1 repressor [Haloferax sp. Atlit-4N]RDZ49816.1 PhiH1 repressor [Haloferax sp. Atlit-4N]
MTIWDDRILEWAQQNESASAAVMKDSEYFQVSRSSLSRRLKKLSEKGLLQHLGNGVYVITAIGEDYLEGDLDAKSLNSESSSEDTASA